LFLSQALKKKKGVAIRRIILRDLKELKLNLAPLPEQRAIAAKIEQLFSELDNGIANLKAAKSKLEIYRQAILKQAFEGELTKDWRKNNKYGLDSISSVINKVSEQRKRKYEEGCKFSKENGLRTFKPQNLIPIIREYHIQLPKEWIWLSMSDISSADQHSMSSGPFGSCLGTKDYQESGIPVIRGKNIQKGKFVCDDFVFISEEKALSLTRSLAYSGDIIVVAVGSSGEAALVPKELKKSVISQNCNKFTLDESIVDSKFVLFCLQNQIVRTQMTEKTTDTVRTFLSLTSLKSMLIPIPPLIEQKQIVEQIEMKFSVCDKLNEAINQSLEKAQALRQSILKKAFEGKLLSQDELHTCRQQPDWEPAAKLLERIKKDSKTKKS
jgi:type I restriction enzyme S subunit